jgi:hypothetical protein
MQTKNIILFCPLFAKTKKFSSLIEEFYRIFRENSALLFPKYIKNIFLKSFFLSKKIGIKYFWIFSEKKIIFFLSILNLFDKPIISFQILKFSLQKEVFNYSLKKNFIFSILLMNNFPLENLSDFFLVATLKKIFPIHKKIGIENVKKIKIILMDFIKQTNKVEFRCYKIYGTILLFFSRNIRKELFKNINSKNQKNESNNSSKKALSRTYSFKKDYRIKNNRPSLINVLEIGPRISLRILEISEYPSNKK